MCEIKDISYSQAMLLWKHLWVNRVSPIEPTSAMVLPDSILDQSRSYSTDIGSPTFLGAFVDGEYVGVNSFHRVNDTVRSRGLYVDPIHRGKRIGEMLLRETIVLANTQQVWSYPNVLALHVYKKAGFSFPSPRIYDPIESKSNHYVRTHSSH